MFRIAAFTTYLCLICLCMVGKPTCNAISTTQYLQQLAGSRAVDTLVTGFVMQKGVQSVTIPVKIAHNLVLVPLRINHSLPIDFILDTGVNSTLLTEPALGAMLGLQYAGKVGLRGLGGGTPIEADVARKVHFSLPNIEGQNMNLVVLPPDVLSFSEMFGQPVYGIIGYDLFKAFAIEINYNEQYIRLHRSETYQPAKKATAIPLFINKGKVHITTQITDNNGKLYPANLLIDTGASQAVSLFGSEIPLPYRTINTYIGKGLNGDVMGQLGRVASVQIDKFVLTMPIVCYPDSMAMSLQASTVPWQGSIGGELMRRFNLVFDYTRQKLYLKKSRNYTTAFSYNLSGLEVLTMGAGMFDRFVISHIRIGSAAEAAGIMAGDELIAINGTLLQPHSISEVYGMLNRRAGTTLRLKIRRGTNILRYKWVLLNEL